MLNRLVAGCFLLVALPLSATAQITTITFEDQGLAANSHVNHPAVPGHFTIDGASFNNSYDSGSDFWSGWALTSSTDNTTFDYTNQYGSITGAGAGGSQTYAMAFTFAFPTNDVFHPSDSWINLPAGESPVSIDVTNSAYAYLTLLKGYSQAHAFGPGDFLLMDIRGYSGLDGGGTLVGTVPFYLANFLNGNSTIVNTWQTLDLTAVAGAKSLQFGLQSTDNDETYGLNDPAYVPFDNLKLLAVPEPSTWALACWGLAAAVMMGMRARRTHGRRRADFVDRGENLAPLSTAG